MRLEDIVKKFKIDGEIDSIVPYGEGHINDTYLVTCKNSDKYIFQKLNTNIFSNYKGVMNNIHLVTSFLADIIDSQNGDVKRETMTVVTTSEDDLFYEENNNCYRMFLFISNTKVYQKVENSDVFESSGFAFGKFIARLDAFDATQLVEVIPNFHNTVDRYKNFEKALSDNLSNRKNNVLEEIEFVKAHKAFTSLIVDKIASGNIPLRVTHNDTKLNNVLMDADSNKAICVIDLDTIMPGSLLYDFGDSVRFGCSTALEDEQDLTKVNFDIDLYEAYCRGFLSGIGNKILESEVQMLNIGSMMMTLECGMRFLTDYLNGDTYFKTKYPEHNLVRARTQFKLVKCMEQVSDKMVAIANKYYKK